MRAINEGMDRTVVGLDSVAGDQSALILVCALVTIEGVEFAARLRMPSDTKAIGVQEPFALSQRSAA